MYNDVSGNLPDPTKPLKGTDQTTQVLDRNGKTITDLFAEQNRQYVPLKDIPRSVREAVIATEDQRYYEHPGVDLLGLHPRHRRRHPRGSERPGRIDHHAAVREAGIRRRRDEPEAQGVRGGAGLSRRAALLQGPDPRDVPEHDLLRPRRLRRPDRGQDLLRQAGRSAHGARVRGARRRHQVAALLLAVSRTGGRQGAARRRAGPDAGPGLHRREHLRVRHRVPHQDGRAQARQHDRAVLRRVRQGASSSRRTARIASIAAACA